MDEYEILHRKRLEAERRYEEELQNVRFEEEMRREEELRVEEERRVTEELRMRYEEEERRRLEREEEELRYDDERMFEGRARRFDEARHSRDDGVRRARKRPTRFEPADLEDSGLGKARKRPSSFEPPVIEHARYEEPSRFQPPDSESARYEGPPRFAPLDLESARYEPSRFEPPDSERPRYEGPSRFEPPDIERTRYEGPSRFGQPDIENVRPSRFEPQDIENVRSSRFEPQDIESGKYEGTSRFEPPDARYEKPSRFGPPDIESARYEGPSRFVPPDIERARYERPSRFEAPDARFDGPSTSSFGEHYVEASVGRFEEPRRGLPVGYDEHSRPPNLLDVDVRQPPPVVQDEEFRRRCEEQLVHLRYGEEVRRYEEYCNNWYRMYGGYGYAVPYNYQQFPQQQGQANRFQQQQQQPDSTSVEKRTKVLTTVQTSTVVKTTQLVDIALPKEVPPKVQADSKKEVDKKKEAKVEAVAKKNNELVKKDVARKDSESVKKDVAKKADELAGKNDTKQASEETCKTPTVTKQANAEGTSTKPPVVTKVAAVKEAAVKKPEADGKLVDKLGDNALVVECIRNEVIRSIEDKAKKREEDRRRRDSRDRDRRKKEDARRDRDRDRVGGKKDDGNKQERSKAEHNLKNKRSSETSASRVEGGKDSRKVKLEAKGEKDQDDAMYDPFGSPRRSKKAREDCSDVSDDDFESVYDPEQSPFRLSFSDASDCEILEAKPPIKTEDHGETNVVSSSTNDEQLLYDPYFGTFTSETLVLVPKDYPRARFTLPQQQQLKRVLLEKVMSSKSFTPRFVRTRFQEGAMRVKCANEETRDWLLRVAPKMVPWSGAVVKVASCDEVFKRKRVRVFVSNECADGTSAVQVLKLLEKQNGGLNTQEWYVEESIPSGNGLAATFCIDHDSWSSLAEKEFKLFLGLGQIQFTEIT